MTLANSILEKLPVREIGVKIRSLLPSGQHKDILKRIEVSLLLFDNTLINTASGASADIENQEGEHHTDSLARAAGRLLGGKGGKGEKAEENNILLLLPTADFVATSYSMNVTGEKLIRSALELQSHSLIPAYEENLLLAVNARNQEGVALWFNEIETNRLFRAFEREGLFLSAIMPRSLALLDEGGDEDKTILINDEEGSNISFLQVRGTSIRRLLTVNRADLQQEVFTKQWELEISQLKGESVRNMTAMEDWKGLSQKVSEVPDYCFFPGGAIEEERRIDLARKSKVGLAIAACFVLLLFAPFFSNWKTISDLETELARVEDQTAEPRSLQASINDIELEWGALYEYPDQNIANILVSLNDVIQSSLTSFSIDKGVIDINGSTDDPAYLVELLAEKEAFYNVGQSTSTRGSGQFGIRLNLSSVDFENYEEKYPVVVQGR